MDKCTGGKLFLTGKVRLGHDILTKVQANVTKLHEEERAKKKKAGDNYLQLINNADKVKAMMTSSGTEVKKPKNADLRALLLPIKQKDKMPTLKKDMIQCYELWKHRPYLAVIPDELEID